MTAKLKKILLLSSGATVAVTGATVATFAIINNNEPQTLLNGYVTSKDEYVSISDTLNLSEIDHDNGIVKFEDNTNIDTSFEVTFTNGNVETIKHKGDKLQIIGRNDILKIIIEDTGLKSIELIDCSSLTHVFAGKNQISDVHIEGCHGLWELDLNHNNLSSLKVNELNNLYRLHVDWNEINSLDVSNLHSLRVLWLGSNEISSLDLSFAVNLELIHLDKNEIEFINLSHCNKLYEVYFDEDTVIQWPSYWENVGGGIFNIITNDGISQWVLLIK